jgi:hypothetical protein
MNGFYRCIYLSMVAALVWGCASKSVNTATEYINQASLQWLPLNGTESLVYENDTGTLVFTGTGVETYFEKVRYKTDQDGMFKVNEDYYANMERREMRYVSDTTGYEIIILQERCKGDIGSWDVLHVTLADGFYYQNIIKIITYKTANWNYGESSMHKAIKLNGVQYTNVYYNVQERRPRELYVNQARGIIGFTTSSEEVWTLSQ